MHLCSLFSLLSSSALIVQPVLGSVALKALKLEPGDSPTMPNLGVIGRKINAREADPNP